MSEDGGEGPRVPESVGPYRIVDRIGAGGMGEVYRAHDDRLDRWVAIKQIRPNDTDIQARERLRREARAVAGLSHPAIVQVHDIVETEDGVWIVMELVDGPTLQELIEEGRLDMELIVNLAEEIAEGLAEAHAKGIIHRDLKTENIKVTDLGHAKILDFGLAKRLWNEGQDHSLSVPGSILGTSRAMSPEQVLGEPVDHRSDLFSFGTLLFETVTGQRPFVGSSLIITLAQVCTEEHGSARSLNPAVPQELSDLIDRLLAKDALQRPQSAGEVVEVLQRIAARLASASMGESDFSDTAVSPIVAAPPPVVGRGSLLFPSAASRSGSALTATGPRFAESTSGIFIKTLVQTELIDSARLGDRFGDARAYEIFSRHDRMVRDVLAQHEGIEIYKTEDDCFLFLFERPVDGVEFVLSYQRQLTELSAELEAGLEARAGIHLSEIFLRENTSEEIHRGAQPFEVEGLAKLLVARLRALAGPGQTLLTQEAHDMTRRALVGHRLGERKLHWMDRGRYMFSGVDEVVRLFEVSTEPIADVALSETADAQRVGEDGRPRRRQRQATRMLLAAAALFLVVISSALLRLYVMKAATPELSGAGMAQDSGMRTSLAVLGFRNISGRPSYDWMSTALAELLSTDLAAGEDLRLIDGESVARLRSSQPLFEGDTLAPDTLEAIRGSLGVDYVILGSYLYLEEGRQLTVQMKLQDARRGETFASVSRTGSEGDLLGLVSGASDVVRQKLGLAAISRERAQQAVRATLSQDPEANRLYFEALESLRAFDAMVARDVLEQALAIDPEFAMAHAALSEAWLALGYDKEAEESATRAFQLAEGRGLPREEYLWIQGSFHEAAGNWQEAIETHQALRAFFPDDVNYGLRLAKAQIGAGEAHEALETVAALRRLPPPNHRDPRIDLMEATAAIARGRNEQVLEAAQWAIDKGRAQGNSVLVAEAQRLKGRALTHLGRPEESAKALEEAQRLFFEAGDEAGVANVLFNFAVLMEGKRNLSRAEEYLREAMAIYERTGSRKDLARAQNGLAYMIQGQGELVAARQLVEEAFKTVRELDYSQREINYLDTLVWILFQLAELERAEDLGRELVALCQELGQRRGESWANLLLAQIALSEGDLPKAQALFEKVLRMADEREDDHLSALGSSGLGAVYLTIGDLSTAHESFARYWRIQEENHWGEQAVTEPQYVLTLLEIGHLEEAVEKAQLIANRFREAERIDYQATALEIEARALWQNGRYDEARVKLGQAQELGGDSEAPEVRLRLAMAASRHLAPEDYREASRRLRHAIGEARQLGLRGVELEASLALGQLEARFAPPDGLEMKGAARLQATADEARRWGFGLIARHAAEELARLESGEGPSAEPTS